MRSQARKARDKAAPQPFQIAKIDDVNHAVRAHALRRRQQGPAPVGNHRQAVGKYRVVERFAQPEQVWTYIFGQRVTEQNPVF